MQKQMENGEQVSIETAPYESKFNSLYSINVNEKVEKKNGLTYLSWEHVRNFFVAIRFNLLLYSSRMKAKRLFIIAASRR